MENNKFKIFIISIEENDNRYLFLLEKLKEQGFNPDIIELFIGIDYKKVNIPLKVISRWGKYSPKEVLAYTASHVLLWNYISKQDLYFALILDIDSYIIKKDFDYYLSDFKKVINDDTLINLSTSFIIQEDKTNDLFIESLLILNLNTYILTPGLCKKLFEFYKNNGLSYYIGIHFAFIKNYIPMKLLHFNRKITEKNIISKTSTLKKKYNFFSRLKDTNVYKTVNTPIVEYQELVFNTYHVILYFIFILILSITFLIVKKLSYINIYNFLYLSLLWALLGFCIYDIL